MDCTMTAKFAAKLFGVVLVAALLSACGSGGRTLATVDEGQIPPGKTASLKINKGADVQREQFVEISRRFHHALSRRLLAERIFVSVVDSTEPADYRMIVSIDRVLAGSYSWWRGKRRGVLEAGVSLYDNATNEQIKLFQATGVGSRNPFSAEGYGVDDPLYEAVEQIILTFGGQPEPSS